MTYNSIKSSSHDIIRTDCSRRGGGVAIYIKKSLSNNHKLSFFLILKALLLTFFFQIKANFGRCVILAP